MGGKQLGAIHLRCHPVVQSHQLHLMRDRPRIMQPDVDEPSFELVTAEPIALTVAIWAVTRRDVKHARSIAPMLSSAGMGRSGGQSRHQQDRGPHHGQATPERSP
jgi:hypothetical protein